MLVNTAWCIFWGQRLVLCCECALALGCRGVDGQTLLEVRAIDLKRRSIHAEVHWKQGYGGAPMQPTQIAILTWMHATYSLPPGRLRFQELPYHKLVKYRDWGQ